MGLMDNERNGTATFVGFAGGLTAVNFDLKRDEYVEESYVLIVCLDVLMGSFVRRRIMRDTASCIIPCLHPLYSYILYTPLLPHMHPCATVIHVYTPYIHT